MKILKFLLLTLIVLCGINENSAIGQTTYYWIGGTGNWTDQTHWSLTSGGPAAATMPSTNDNVRFDAASGPSGYVVSNTVTATVARLTATNSNPLTLDVDLIVNDQFLGPLAACTFGSIGKTLSIIVTSPFIGTTFNPGNFTFAGALRLEGGSGLSNNITVNDNIFSTNQIFLDNGKITFSCDSVTCQKMISVAPVSDNRNFTFSNCKFFITENEWLFHHYPVTRDRPEKVVFQGAMNAIFKDSVNITATHYDTLIIPAISKITIPTRIGIGYISSSADTMILGANEGIGIKTLNAPGLNCNNRLYIQSNSLTIKSKLRYNGPGTTMSFNYYSFDGIAAQNTPTITYAGLNSIQVNSTGFEFGGIPHKFYWIGNSGNWTDSTHWSDVSGGTTSCYYPENLDSLIFDVNSFNTLNQVVLMDTSLHVGFMDWTGINPLADTVKFTLTKNLQAYGNITLDPLVHILSSYDTVNFQYPSLEFKSKGDLDVNSSTFDVNLVLNPLATDTVKLVSDFFSTDSSSIYLQNGSFKTNNFDIKTLSFLSYSASTSIKNFYMGNSTIWLKDGWDTDTSDYYLNTFPGNSHIIIGRSKDSNYFKSKNQQFHDLTFDFNPKTIGKTTGSNSMHHLTITGGSQVQFESGSSFTLDSLIINGGCNKFRIDTTFGYTLDYDTISIDTMSIAITNFTPSNDTNFYGFVAVIPAVTLRDTVFTMLNGSIIDTTITSFVINNAPILDTTIVGTDTLFNGSRSDTNYVIRITVEIDTLGSFPIYDFGVDNDTLTGIQEVNLLSSTAGSQFNFLVNRNQNVYGTHMKDIRITGGSSRNAYFSTNISNNTGWAFSTSPSSTADFSLTGSYCLGDTIAVNNTSTSFSGNFSDLISVWNFGQTEYLGDSSIYVYTSAGVYPISLTTYYTNSCSSVKRDTLTIKSPNVSFSMSEIDTLICANTSIEFSATSLDSMTQFEFFKNGVSLLGPSLVDSIIISNIVTNDIISVNATWDGCESVDPPQFKFNVIPLPIVNLISSDSNDSICIGESVTFTASGASKYRYYKNNLPLNFYSSTATYTVNNLVNNDTISVRGRIDSSLCINKSADRIFIVNPLPTVTLTTSAASPICAGTSVTFTASGANLYEFFVNGVSVSGPGTTSTYTTNTLTNNAVITVKGTSLAGCSKTSSPMNYTVVPNPIVSIAIDDSDSTICNGTSVNFYGYGGSQYEFFVNNTSQGPASPTNSFSSATLANSDLVKVTASFGLCSSTSSAIPVTVLANPTTTLVSSDANDTICQTESLTYTASGASMYEFFVNGVSTGALSSNSTYTNNNFTNASTISVVGNNSGCTVSAQKVIAVLPKPNVNVASSSGSNVICTYNQITFTGSGAASYVLVTDGILGSSQVSPTFTSNLSSGLHTISLIGTALNGCSNTSNSTINVTVNTPPTASLTSTDVDQIICAGTSVTFTGAGASSYQFLINGISQTANSSISTFTTSSLTNGQIISVKGTTNGCADTSNLMTFTVNAVPNVMLTSTDVDNIYCQGQTTTFNSSGASSYEFFVNNASQGVPSATSSFSGTSLSPGSYTISVQGTTNSCSATRLMNVIVNPNPIAGITSSDADNVICEGDAIQFTGSGGSQYEFFVGALSQGPPSALNSFTSSTLTDGVDVNVIALSIAGCASTSSTINTTVNALPNVAITSNDIDQTICAGEAVTFTGSGANNYEFFINNISQGPASSTATFSTSGLTNGQIIRVKGTSLGCSSNSSNMPFNVNPYPSISATNPSGTILCGNTPAVVNLSGAGTYQFLIDGNPVGPFSATSSFNQTVVDGSILTFSGNSFGCITNSPASFTFNVTSTPVLTLSSSDPDLTICRGEEITITATGAQNYDFSLNGLLVQTGSLSTFITSDLEDGFVISAQGFNATCPSSVETLTYSVNSLPLTLAINPSYIVCEGDQIVLEANGADMYQFYTNGAPSGTLTAVNTLNHQNVQTGDNFTVNGVNTTTGCSQELGYNIAPSVISTVSFNTIGNPTFCTGDSIVMVSNVIYGNQWTLNGSPIAGATNDTLIAFTSGDYGLIQTLGGTGAAWSVGYNGSGGFGDFTNIDSPLAVPATLAQTLTNITSGYDFAVGLTSSGTVYAWGTNGSGQLGNGTFTTTNFPILVPTLSNIIEIASSSSSTIALNDTGTLSVWGNNNYGQLGVGSNAIINFPFSLSSVTNVSQIVGGKDHFIALKTDGTVWSVGRNNLGQLGLGNLVNANTYTQIPGLTGITKIGSGENHSFAIASNGDLFVWGNNVNGQLGLGDNNNRLSPTLSTLKNVTDATGGANHSLILNQSKEVFAVGGNGFGQLGVPSILETTIPQKLTVGGILEISAGEFTSLLRTTDLKVLGAGYNAEQQIQPTAGNVTTFTLLNNFNGVTKIEAGRRTSHAIFGESGSCNSTDLSVVANTSTIPVITDNNNVLTSTSAIGYQWYHNGVAIPQGTQQNYTVFSTGAYFVETTNANGCISRSAIINIQNAGMDDKELLTINIYPNPSTGIYHLNFSKVKDDFSSEVVDLTGRIVKTRTPLKELNNSLDLTSQENGTYFLRIYKNNELQLQKPLVIIK